MMLNSYYAKTIWYGTTYSRRMQVQATGNSVINLEKQRLSKETLSSVV